MEMDPAKNAKIDYSTLWGRLISHCKETLQIEADNAKRAKSFQTKNKLAEKERRRFDENLMKNIKNPNDIVISFQDFPFFLSDDTKSFMIASSGIHLDASLAEVRNLAPKSLFETPRILLLGPSEFYQEAVSKAIAKHFDARLLIVDLLSFSAFSLWGTTIKEAESSKRNSKKKIRLETHFFEAGSRVSYRNVIGVNVPGEPMNGSTGLVLLNFEDNTRAKVGVKFDKYFQGGNDLRGISKVGHGYFCKALYLHLLETPSEKDDFHNKIMNNIFEFASNQAKRGSLVVLLQNLEKALQGEWHVLENVVENLPSNVVLIASHTKVFEEKTQTKKKQGPSPFFLLQEKISRQMEESNNSIDEFMDQIGGLFPNKFTIQLPKDHTSLSSSNQQLEHHVRSINAQLNAVRASR